MSPSTGQILRARAAGCSLAAALLALAVADPASALPPEQRTKAAASRMANWRSQRIGMYIHWGPYSTLGGVYQGKSYRGNAEWIMRTAAISRHDYRAVAEAFDPPGFDAKELVAFAKDSGFRYMIVTAKHYDGFALFDSKASDFNSVLVSPSKRDFMAEFAKACSAASMPLGFCYTVDRDWHHPGGNTLGPPWDPTQVGSRDAYLKKVALPQIRELTSRYGTPFVLHADLGKGVPPRLVPEFEAAIDPRTVLTWNFSGGGDYIYTSGRPLAATHRAVDWEFCRPLGGSWGYRSGQVKWEEPGFIIRELATTASKGGNYRLNVGLDGQGQIPPEAKAVIETTGRWLRTCGEAIYDSSRSPFMVHPWDGVATVKSDKESGHQLYLHVFSHPEGKLSLEGLLPRPESAEVLGSGRTLAIDGRPGKWTLDLGKLEASAGVTVVRVKLPSSPVIGPSAIEADETGGYQLDFARAKLADPRTEIGRTPASVELQLTGLRDEKESAAWELYAASSQQVKLQALIVPSDGIEGKKLLIRVNGEEVATATITRSEVAGASSPAEWLLTSAPFRLPAGDSTLTVTGDRDQERPVPAGCSKIDLIQAH